MAISPQPDGTLRTAGSGDSVMSTFTQGPDSLDVHVMSVALIGPEEQRRQAVARALAGSQANVTREFASYPDLDDVPQLLDADYDVSSTWIATGYALVLWSISPTALNSNGLFGRAIQSCWSVAWAGARGFLVSRLRLIQSRRRCACFSPSSGCHSSRSIGQIADICRCQGSSGVSTIASNFAVCCAGVPQTLCCSISTCPLVRRH
jgi:hypothetical protein